MIGKWLANLYSDLIKYVESRQPEDVRMGHRFKTESWGFLYTEGDYRAKIGGDMLTGNLDFVVYPNQLTGWLAPYENEPMSDEKKEEILARLLEWMQQQGIRYTIDHSHW
ncbi:MAG: hypothetical protein IH586_13200 [Anaerolineaceae bacterium]|nr:hypothetical protein [Anaerolineaceae bacterium]